MVQIYGKDTCPYTLAAREHYVALGVPVEYHNVKKDQAALAEMLVLTHGKRHVPVIVENGAVTIGYGGT